MYGDNAGSKCRILLNVSKVFEITIIFAQGALFEETQQIHLKKVNFQMEDELSYSFGSNKMSGKFSKTTNIFGN